MDNLDTLRKKIDALDDNIVKLLLERFEVIKDVAEYKKERGLEIFQQAREAEVLKKIADITEKSGNQDYKKYILCIYKTILETSKISQSKL